MNDTTINSIGLNEKASRWWSERFLLEDKKEQFRQAIVKHLPDTDWSTYVDYDPEGCLLDAVRDVVPCRGFLFSAEGLLPLKTGLRRLGNKLYSKEGYGSPWLEIT